MTGMQKSSATPLLVRVQTSCRTTYTEKLMGESRVIFRWRSSLWKLIWKELLLYTVNFLLISMVYRFALKEEQKNGMEKLITWCRKQSTGLPLTFLLGFYVSLVVRRWWEQYCKLPWPDSIAIFLRGLLVGGQGDRARMFRRSIIRYCLLSYVLCLRSVSVRLRKRFPTMQELVRSGIIRTDEAVRIGKEESSLMYDSNWWMPLKWSTELMCKAQQNGMVSNAPGYAGLMGKISEFRKSLTEVATYGHIPVPLVYTQVVTLAVYVYFAVCLVGEQWTMAEEIDLIYPIFMTVKFLFFFGWLRVAETLYNPFGEDDDDFELNELLNRHFKVALQIVDEDEDPPALQKDIFWGQTNPKLEDHPDWGDMNITVHTDDTNHEPEEYEATACNAEKRDPML